MTRIGVTSYLLLTGQAPSPRTFDDASNQELRIEQAFGEAWQDGVHCLRCETERESKLRPRLDNVNVATARTLNNAMHSCIRRAQLSRSSAERLVHQVDKGSFAELL